MKALQAVLYWAMETYKVHGKPLLALNPVSVLSQKHLWHDTAPRHRVVPDEVLPQWYQAVMKLTSTIRRDLLLVSLFAGLSLHDLSGVTWEAVDLKNGILTVRTGDRVHRLPLSDFLLELFRQRHAAGRSLLVFAGQGGKPIRRFEEPTEKSWERGRFGFTQGDLRLTFLSIAERLQVSQYVYKALSNRVGRHRPRGGHVEYDVEKLRKPMQAITDELLELVSDPSREKRTG
jgi:integrase